MMSEPEAALTLLSGASVAPNRPLQRRRARIASRKHRMFATIAGGGPPASTRSKCSRERSSSRLRKNARASSRCMRTRPGRSIRMARSAAMASSSRAVRSASPVSARREASMAARPRRKRTSVRSEWSGASGPRTASASEKRPFSTSARASTTRGSEDRWERSEAASAGAWSRTATARVQIHFIIATIIGTEKKKGSRGAALLPFGVGEIGPRVTPGPRRISRRSSHHRSR